MPAVPALDAHEFLRTLAVVLMVAAGASVLFQRLRLPVVFGYLAAGMIVGPYTSIPFVANEAIVQSLSELGVILLMFSIGLEFRLRRVGQVAGTAGIAALLETGLMFGLGALLADLLGWTPFERLVAGAMVAISSTTIIARTFAELKVGGRVAELVFGVLIIEDLIAIVLLATLGALATGGGLGVTTIGITLVQLGTFLTGLLAVGLLVVPRFMRAVIGLGRDETTLVAAVGVLLRCGPARALVRLLGGARGLRGRLARRRVGAVRSGRASRASGARRLRRDLLRLRGDAARPRRRSRAPRHDHRLHGAGDGRQDPRGVDGGLPQRRRPPDIGAGRALARADRRVLVPHRHARRGGRGAQRDLHHRRRRLRDHHARDAHAGEARRRDRRELVDRKLPHRLQTFAALYGSSMAQVPHLHPARTASSAATHQAAGARFGAPRRHHHRRDRGTRSVRDTAARVDRRRTGARRTARAARRDRARPAGRGRRLPHGATPRRRARASRRCRCRGSASTPRARHAGR